MKKTETNYNSPNVELLEMACEQAVMVGSTQSMSDITNEKFVAGGTFSSWQ